MTTRRVVTSGAGGVLVLAWCCKARHAVGAAGFGVCCGGMLAFWPQGMAIVLGGGLGLGAGYSRYAVVRLWMAGCRCCWPLAAGLLCEDRGPRSCGRRGGFVMGIALVLVSLEFLRRSDGAHFATVLFCPPFSDYLARDYITAFAGRRPLAVHAATSSVWRRSLMWSTLCRFGALRCASGAVAGGGGNLASLRLSLCGSRAGWRWRRLADCNRQSGAARASGPSGHAV